MVLSLFPNPNRHNELEYGWWCRFHKTNGSSRITAECFDLSSNGLISRVRVSANKIWDAYPGRTKSMQSKWIQYFFGWCMSTNRTLVASEVGHHNNSKNTFQLLCVVGRPNEPLGEHESGMQLAINPHGSYSQEANPIPVQKTWLHPTCPSSMLVNPVPAPSSNTVRPTKDWRRSMMKSHKYSAPFQTYKTSECEKSTMCSIRCWSRYLRTNIRQYRGQSMFCRINHKSSTSENEARQWHQRSYSGDVEDEMNIGS